MTTSNGGWNIGYSSSLFGISLNNGIQALSINNTGLITIPQGIAGYSTTSQVNTLITNDLSSYTITANLSSNYVTNSSLSNYVTTSSLSNYSTTSQTNNLISSSIESNQNIMGVHFLSFVNASDFSSNVYNYNNLFH